MSIDSPTGILDIRNATLKVSKLEVTNATGFDTALNNIARNTILLVDSTEQTASNSWALKLPNAWVGEFEGYWASGATGDIDFNFYNNTTSGTNGYTLSMDDTTIVVKYDGVTLQTTTISSTLKTDAYRKVSILFERDTISMSIDGSRELYFKDSTLRSRVYDDEAGGYITVGGLDSTNRKFKNLKVVNEKWISDGTSNIAYIGGGEVAIGQSLNLQQVSNVASIKLNSNVVTEFVRSKKLIKYPRVAMTQNDESSTTGYVASASSVYGDDSTYAYNSFVNTVGNHWLSSSNSFDGAPDVFNGVNGPWISIQLPDAIKLEYLEFYVRNGSANQLVTAGNVYASNDGSNWYSIGSLDNLGTYTTYLPARVNFTHTTLYDRYLLHITSFVTNYASMERLSLYGTPEYDPEAHGTDVIMRSVPNVPNTDWLEVYWDAGNTSSYSGSGTTVTDLSGNGVTGTITGTNGFDSTYNAWEFDGSGDYIQGTTSIGTGEVIHTWSLWVKNLTPTSTQYAYICGFGSASSANMSGFMLRNGDQLEFTSLGTYVYVSEDFPYRENTWKHVVGVYRGDAWNSTNCDVYIDGIKAATVGSSTTTLNISGTAINIGSSPGGGQPFVGSIANARVFNRALTGDEVWQLYAYQKEYFNVSPDVVTFKGGRLGIGTSEPRAVLDVRGSIQANGHPVWPVPVAQFYKASPGNLNQGYTENITRTGRVDFNRTLVETPGVIERYTWTSSTSRTTSDASSGGIIKFCLPGVYYVTAGVSIAKQLTHDKGFGFDFYQASVLGGYLRAGYAGGNPSYGSVTPDTQVNSVDGHRRMWMVRVTEAPAYGYIFIQPSNNSGSYFRFQTYTENPYAHVDIFYLG